MGAIEHFRYIVGHEAERLTGNAERIGKPFIRKAITDAIEILNAHLHALEGAAVVQRMDVPAARFVAGARPSAVEPARVISVGDPIGRIVEIVAEELRLDVKRVRAANRRDDEGVFARQVCMYFARTILDLSYQRIANGFGKRDHSTAMHAHIRVQAEVDAGRLDADRWAKLTQRVAEVKPPRSEMQQPVSLRLRSRKTA